MNDDLVGKTVECGSCDHRFLVKEESIFAERSKVYPGENIKRDDDFLSRLGRDQSTAESNRKEKSMVGGGQPRVYAIMPAGALPEATSSNESNAPTFSPAAKYVT